MEELTSREIDLMIMSIQHHLEANKPLETDIDVTIRDHANNKRAELYQLWQKISYEK